ncbi:MAG: hypothetical protein PHH93_08060 [Prolixibacteraceae bacterium]|nr:hypothetical protein [Prolixibacteraceae bacterium]
MNTAYPLIPVSVITIAAYFITWLYSEWNIFPRAGHRKFWNYLLLITFLVSGLTGVISVIKINYKIEIPYYDQLIKWHVSFGIGMAVIAFFHFFNHFSYYFSWLHKRFSTTKKIVHADAEKTAPGKFRYLLFILGAVTMINQVIFIREFIGVFSGNELILGVIMATWMLLTGWGAFTGRKKISTLFTIEKGVTMIAFLTFIPVVLFGLLYWIKYLLFPPGTMTGLTTALSSSFLMLFPVCFLSGYLFTAFSTLYSVSEAKNLIGKAYALESFGSLAGGLLFSIILGRFFNSLQVLGLTTGLVLLSGAWLLAGNNRSRQVLYIAGGIILPVAVFLINPDLRLKKILFPNQKIILNRSTRYGNLVVTEQAGQYNFYENNTLQFYTENVIENEEAVHFAMARHDNPRRVLLISGGIAGMIKEIKKYDVEKITYLETNPEVFIHWKNAVTDPGYDEAVEIVKKDIRSYLNKTKTIYDVILINLPPPSTLGYNRFYTDEFFSIIKKHCNRKTIVSANMPSLANYAEENALEIQSSFWKTLGLHFDQLLLVPGEKNYFIASDSHLSAEITIHIMQKGIETEYVNQYYTDDNLLNMRSNTLVAQFDESVATNYDFKPYMFVKQSNHWLSHFNISYRLIIIIPALLFILLFFKQNALTAGLYTGGFTASSLEIVIMLAYQIFAGSIYLATAFFFTAFMGGLTAGSYRKIKVSGERQVKSYYILQFLLALFALSLPLLINFADLIAARVMLVQLFFFSLVFALAFGIGYEFNLASVLQKKSYSETSGINYSTDLAGSALGALLTALFLLPVLGLTYTCIIVAALNILSGTIAYSSRKKQIFV